MKHLKVFIILAFIPLLAWGQDIKYRRSSLCPFMIVETGREYSDVIQKTFVNSPIPDKFNDHKLDQFTINNGIVNKIQSRNKKTLIQSSNITNYLETNNIAKKIVAKWFNRDIDGSFNMELVAHRGLYDASELDKELAEASKRKLVKLADAGEELIKNTFVIVNDFDYVNKEKVAKKTNNFIDFLLDIAEAFGFSVGRDIKNAATYTKKGLKTFGKGYFIRTTSYLYRLVWDEEVAAIFYNDYWMDKNNIDENKKRAFDNSNIFKLEYIGYETAFADLQSTVFTSKSDEELIAVATMRAADKAIVKLQKKYEVFRTKTPLYSVNPLSARIGMKEGLKKGDRFEVLERVMNNQGKTMFEKRGTIKVDKNHIWDNRYEAGKGGDEYNYKSTLGFTKFKGSGNFYPGMLIRQKFAAKAKNIDNVSNNTTALYETDKSQLISELMQQYPPTNRYDTNKSKFRIGATIGKLRGDIKEFYSMPYGLDLNYIWNKRDRVVNLGIFSGYFAFKEKYQAYSPYTYTHVNMRWLNGGLCLRFNISKRFVLGSDMGIAYLLNAQHSDHIYIRILMGLNISKTLQITASYRKLDDFDFLYKIKSLNLGLNFGF